MNLNKELAKAIADTDDGEYLPSHEEWSDLQALEAAGMVEMAGLYHPVCATYRITDQGKRRLESLAPPAA
jgi:hypothetical protein